MNKIATKLLFMLLLAVPLIYGCQKEELMMSKDTVSKQISYTWTQLFTPSETSITWKFEDGKMHIRQNESERAQGNYSVDCSLTKVKVKLDGFTGGFDYLNKTWQVISLDDKGLVITDLDKGIMEYEFVRKD
jgi:hypothetical protein